MLTPLAPPRRPIILDTDPGQDDALALMMALGRSDRLDVLGVTVVAGNVGLPLTQRNARIICEWAGRPDMAVYAGCDRPLQGREPGQTAESVHGQEGLEGPVLHAPTMPLQAKHAVDFLVETLAHAAPSSVTLCPIGPLTNLAQALRRNPSIRAGVKEIVLMGGAQTECGNITPCAEFNIAVDPEAAALVFSAGMPITMLPLDVTHQVRMSPQRIARLAALGNRCGLIASQILSSYERAELYRFADGGGPLHDPCVVAYLLDPSLFVGQPAHVSIETRGEHTRGMTVVDYWGRSGQPSNVTYLRQVDAEGLFSLLCDAIARLP